MNAATFHARTREGIRNYGHARLVVKHASLSNPELSFWAEPVEDGSFECPGYVVLSQYRGYPVTEAFDDWLAHFRDADEIARKLARGEDVS